MTGALSTTGATVAPDENGGMKLAVARWTPSASFAEDKRLANCIRQALGESGYSVLQEVGVAVHEGAIVLRGTVPTFFMKQMAQEIAKASSGVKSLTNRLAVRTVETALE